jgi:hypothetical protein
MPGRFFSLEREVADLATMLLLRDSRIAEGELGEPPSAARAHLAKAVEKVRALPA